MTENCGNVYKTNDFDQFSILTGNRKDLEKRKSKIAKSVESVGYIPAPIIVNEKMEIIDGQARFSYCKEHGIPISYFIIDGLTIDECIAMNISASNWGLMDYIESYADRGLRGYVLAEKFINLSPYGINPSIWALTGTDATNISEKIKSGNLDIGQKEYFRGLDIIDFWKKFDDIVTNRKNQFLTALGYCYLIPEVDNDLLVRKIHLRPRDFQTIANVTDAIDVIEDVYNVRNRNHVYIETEYFKYLDAISKGIKESIISKREQKKKGDQ